MFEGIIGFFKKLVKSETNQENSKDTAKERLHLVLMQDRANVSADFLELMKQEIIEVIKKYIEVEESQIDVRLTNEVGEDGKQGAPSLYANIPIKNIKNGSKNEIENEKKENNKEEIKSEEKQEEVKEETIEDSNNEETIEKDKKEPVEEKKEEVSIEENKIKEDVEQNEKQTENIQEEKQEENKISEEENKE